MIAELRALLGAEEVDWNEVWVLLDACVDESEYALLKAYVGQHHPDWHGLWAPGEHAGESRELSELPDVKVVWCPPGRFLMGASDSDSEAGYLEKPQHEVVLSRGFWVWETPVTQQQFEELMDYNPSRFPKDGENHPVGQVNWHEAAAFCNKLSSKVGLPEVYELEGEGKDVLATLRAEYMGNDGRDYTLAKGYRLGTEAEWEYACRAGTKTSRYGELETIGWYGVNAKTRTQAVRGKEPNGWGLYDMLGNVYEWVFDFYEDYAKGGLVVDPTRAGEGSGRVIRGGSWLVSPLSCRASYRFRVKPAHRDFDLGFRPFRSS